MPSKNVDLCGYYVLEALQNSIPIGTEESCDYGHDYCPPGAWCPIQQTMIMTGAKKGIDKWKETS